MSDENFRELHSQHRAHQDKYAYFLLTAAGAAVAFAVVRTEGRTLNWPMVLLGVAVLSWGLSFLCGCFRLLYMEVILHNNYELLQIQRGIHREVGDHPNLMAAAEEGLREAMAMNSSKAKRFSHWQFGALVSGFVLYVAWHVVDMAIRTATSP